MKSILNAGTIAEPAAPEPWVLRLRNAYQAGFYRTEAAVDEQVSFPWQGKTCRDCPFWSDNVCSVFLERRSALAHTCCYFDRANRGDALDLIQSRAGVL
jgi:hypothetical protein